MVGVVNPSVTDQELRQMHDAGVRGIRFNPSPPGATTLDMIEPLAKRIEPMGWHCQINAPADQTRRGTGNLLARAGTAGVRPSGACAGC